MKMKKGHPRPARLSILHQNQSSDSDDLVSGGTWPSCRSERPLIAVPFDWEDQPGVPKQQQKSSVHSPCEPRDRDLKQSGNSTTNRAGAGHHKGVQSLTPPPRLMMLGGVTGACIDKRSSEQYMDPISREKNASLNSPRSPRSISLSRKMKSLLPGRMNSAKSTEQIHSINSINSINSIHSTPSLWDQAGFRKMIKEVDESEEDDYSASQSSSSNDIVFEGELLRSKLVSSPQQQQQPVSPFKNMSNLLLELWYGGSGSTSSISSPAGMNHVAFEMISSSSSDLESPGSSTDNSLSSFSSDSYESHHHLQQLQVQVPRQDHEIKTSFDSYDESSLNDDEQLLAAAARVGTVPDKVEEESDEDFSIDFHYSSNSSRDFFAQKFYYKSDRFRVESYESASLLGAKQDDEQEEQQQEQEEQVPVNVQPLPSALKKENSIARKSLKKVRFVFEVEEAEAAAAVAVAVEDEEHCDNEQDEPQNSPVNTSPVLSRYSSRPASRFNEEEEADDTCSPSPRTKRDLSQLFMQIIQADVEMSRKQKGAGIKSMFRSRW